MKKNLGSGGGLDIISAILFLLAVVYLYLFFFEGMEFVALAGALLNVLIGIGIAKRFDSVRMILIFFLWIFYLITALTIAVIVLGFIFSMPKLNIYSGFSLISVFISVASFVLIIWIHNYLRKPDVKKLFKTTKV
ncbi:MAG: hypothetical protein JW896_01150 [Deltaproteobacteria bacterium]|nr:hypothetical protein [Deltaproteobacteria bacterium]